ncbi:MAG: N-acetylmuramidase domain-containing protein [Pseudomonadota bacterium]
MSLTLTDDDIIHIASLLNIEPALLDAIRKTEAPNGGFDSKGRLIILPEKHKIYQYMSAKERHIALRKNLVTKRWSKKTQYKGFGSYRKHTGFAGDRRWGFVERVSQVNKYATYMGTSFGLMQIMGFNYRLCGYNTVFDMVSDFETGEKQQLFAAVRFIKSKGKIDVFVDRDFRGIAAFYNGTGQIEYYASILEQHYRASNLPKCTSTPERRDMRLQALRFGSRGVRVKVLQERFNELGYICDVDGIFGERLEDQVVLFQRHNALTTDGVVGPKTQAALETAEPIPTNETPISDVLTKNPIVNSGVGQVALGVGSGGAGIGTVVSKQPEPITLEGTHNMLDLSVKISDKTEQLIDVIPKLASFALTYSLVLVSIALIGFGAWTIYRTIKNHRLRRWFG